MAAEVGKSMAAELCSKDEGGMLQQRLREKRPLLNLYPILRTNRLVSAGFFQEPHIQVHHYTRANSSSSEYTHLKDTYGAGKGRPKVQGSKFWGLPVGNP